MRLCPPLKFCSEHWSRRSPPDHKKKRTAQVRAVPIEECLRGLTDPVNLGPAQRARSDCCRFAVLHCYWLRVLHLDLSLVLQTIAFHLCHRLTDFVNLGSAIWASPHSRRLAVLHRDRLRAF